MATGEAPEPKWWRVPERERTIPAPEPKWQWETVEDDDVDRFVASVLAELDKLQAVNAKKPRWRRAMGVVVFVMRNAQQQRIDERKKAQLAVRLEAARETLRYIRAIEAKERQQLARATKEKGDSDA